jgi:hypothetical protein
VYLYFPARCSLKDKVLLSSSLFNTHGCNETSKQH